ncbi:MAG TPA: metal-dependent hydrolase [Thermomicrobiales bacterium]|nr:metal-dependent hydrolase [Thermomicrobiales bacterium]
MKLTYFGHSAFLFDDGQQHTVLLDPFMSSNPTCGTSPSDVNPDAILLTHAHNDHVGDTVSIATRSEAKVFATVELANFLSSQGVENVVGANHGGTVTFPGGTAKFVPAWHSSSYTTEDGTVVASGVPAGFVIRFGGKTIYAAGDTALFMDMQLIGDEEIDIALLPIGDHFTMGPEDARKAIDYLRPGTVVPCHCNTFPAIEQDRDAFRNRVEGETATRVVVMDPDTSRDF